MARRFETPVLVICLIYLGAIAMTTALLVFWVAVVQRFNAEINEQASRLGVEWSHFHWFVHTTGAGLFFLVLVALTYLLAVTLSERRYSRKQQEFLSTVTHELRTPLTAIRLHGQTLEQEDLTPEERRESVRFILDESQRIGKLVDNLLASSRLLAGRPDQLEPIDLRDFFARYQEVVRGRFPLRRVDLRFEVHTRSVVMATTESLQHIMDNLIDNALRVTRRGDEVLCSVRDALGGAEIVVSDRGAGIPKRELERVFERFYRLRRDGESGQRGTGLGLAIVRGLVEGLSGRIRAVSGDDAPGTRFEIRLPEAEGRRGEERP